MSTKREGVPEYEKADLDEEIFVLRAQDSLAPVVVQLWSLQASMHGVSQDKIEKARACAKRMRSWQELYGCKVPD